MSNELKPCPFCGGEAEYRAAKYVRTAFKHSVVCLDCFASIPPKDSKHEAINAWNTRAERTCTMTKLEPPLLLEGWWSCSECGPVFPPCNDEIAVGVLQQCPHCGAKVVNNG